MASESSSLSRNLLHPRRESQSPGEVRDEVLSDARSEVPTEVRNKVPIELPNTVRGSCRSNDDAEFEALLCLAAARQKLVSQSQLLRDVHTPDIAD